MLLMGVGGAKIKRVLRGTATFPQDGIDVYVTIGPIDPSKSFLVFSKMMAPPVVSIGGAAFPVMGKIHGPTQIRFHRATNHVGQTPINWFVIEFARGVSVQTIQTSLSTSATSQTVTISPVDPAKAFVLHSWKFRANIEGSLSTDTSLLHRMEPTVILHQDGTGVSVVRRDSGYVIDVVVQVVEWR